MIYKSLYIPTTFDVIFLKKKNCKELTIILYNKTVYLKFFFNQTNLKLDLQTYCLVFIKNYNNKNDLSYSFNEVNKYLKTFELYFFVKIKFKGKGFKIKFNKKLKLIKFYFGKSHLTFLKFKKIKLKKITKYKFILKSPNLGKLKKIASNITLIKPVNLYTLRGIRLSRQFISKRKGKKSSYM